MNRHTLLLLPLFLCFALLVSCKTQATKSSEAEKSGETTQTKKSETEVPTLEQLKSKHSDLEDIGEVLIVTAYFSDNPYVNVETIGTSDQVKFEIDNIEQKNDKVTFQIKGIEGLSKKLAIEEKFNLAKSNNKYYLYYKKSP